MVWEVHTAGPIQGSNHVKRTLSIMNAWLVGGSCDSVQGVAAVMRLPTACLWVWQCREQGMVWEQGRPGNLGGKSLVTCMQSCCMMSCLLTFLALSPSPYL